MNVEIMYKVLSTLFIDVFCSNELAASNGLKDHICWVSDKLREIGKSAKKFLNIKVMCVYGHILL